MELHKAIKEIIANKGARMITDAQIINFLLDYQAFKEKPATKLILRDVINGGYAEDILNLGSQNAGWQIAFMKYERDFIDSCGYKDDLVKYVFEAIAYGIGLQLSSKEPSIAPDIDVDSFFDIPEEIPEQPSPDSGNANQNQNVNPSDLYSIALTFYNEGKYAQAKSFIEKSVSLFQNSNIPSIQLKLKGDINMKLGNFVESITDYNNCFTRKSTEIFIKIDDLRERLKNHSIEGFENIMFCYYFCLFSYGKITKDQWLKFVKAEAMYGLEDAIIYCVNNGINPMDKHIDVFFKDINNLKNGDRIYSDGTFAHEINKGKKVVARVKLAETTKFEQSHGWTHGYIIPESNNNGSDIYISGKWSTKIEDLPFPHSHYRDDDLGHWTELKTIESEPYISIDVFDDFPAFRAVHDFSLNIPIKGISPWFLPSIHWFKRFSECTWGKDCWTSSQANSFQAICINHYRFYLASKDQVKYILPVAAF